MEKPNFGEDFIFGAPRSDVDKTLYLQHAYISVCALLELKDKPWNDKTKARCDTTFDPKQVPRHHPAHGAVLERIDASLGRVTEKSSGLLQVAGIFVAISALITQVIVAPGSGFDRSLAAEWLLVVGTVLVIVAAGLLSINLSVLWRKAEHEYFGGYDFNRFVLDLLVNRCGRFLLSRMLLSAGGFMILVQLFVVMAKGWG